MTISGTRARVGAQPNWRAGASLLAVYVLWGSTYTGIQVLVRHFPPLLMAGVRYLAAGLILYLLAGHRGSWLRHPLHFQRPSRAEAVGAGVVGLFLLLGGNGLVSWAELRVPSGIASLVIATVPLWMALLGLGLRRSALPGGLGWLGIALGLAGVAFLAGTGSGGHLGLVWVGGLVGAAVLWSIGSLYAQRAPLASNVLLVSAVEMLVGGLALIAAGLLTGEAPQVHWSELGPASVVAFAWLVVGGSLAGYTCYTYALKKLPTSTVATYAYVNPLVALLLGFLILGQGLTWSSGVAAALITAGVLLMVSGPALARRSRRRRLRAAPDCARGA